LVIPDSGDPTDQIARLISLMFCSYEQLATPKEKYPSGISSQRASVAIYS
jgi:hypothetical protein